MELWSNCCKSRKDNLRLFTDLLGVTTTNLAIFGFGIGTNLQFPFITGEQGAFQSTYLSVYLCKCICTCVCVFWLGWCLQYYKLLELDHTGFLHVYTYRFKQMYQNTWPFRHRKDAWWSPSTKQGAFVSFSQAFLCQTCQTSKWFVEWTDRYFHAHTETFSSDSWHVFPCSAVSSVAWGSLPFHLNKFLSAALFRMNQGHQNWQFRMSGWCLIAWVKPAREQRIDGQYQFLIF